MKILLPLLVFCSLIAADSRAQLLPPDNYLLKKDVIYTNVNGWDGRMDIYIPKNAKGKPPIIINIHGGGWVHGTKESEKGFAMFFTEGFIIANIEYRLADKAPAPAAISDIRSAMTYLAVKKDSIGFDPKKVVIMGSSAGAHLALMGGLAGNDRRFDQSLRSPVLKAAAIVDKYGPADLLTYDVMFKPNRASSAWLGGRGNDTGFIRAISPVNYVTKSSPPVLIIHGDKDKTVPIGQSTKLFDAIKTAGGKVEMYTVIGGGHGVFTNEENEVVNNKILDFIHSHIR